ncbi:lysophospholipid acyltransferase family protein [Puniceicoccus vermicola]|uniref:1-acyl-sn-glycerol-3-phosphate acyltransferase n=1 Tax=Puniceicoccus vermicola TaxID=388746 RepID=A0A7X1AW13_9BACT|nr:lysophospholipid acyltransferase family protein [Puniceicoccus vermicola]MBC2601045.1 1-acyl-sn-glycerol-3-phosphate acyltransferase [Puniceicoccus vermicola]
MYRLYQFVAYWIALSVFAGGLVIINIAGPILRLFWKSKGTLISQKLINRLSRFFVWLLKLLGILRVHFVNWPKDLNESSAIIVSNHPSKFDAIAYLTRLPRGFCIFKDALRSSMLFGPTALSIGYLSNKEGPQGLREAIKQLKEGGQFLVFPEGTRSTRKTLQKLYGFYSVVSKYSGRDIHACYIEASSNLLTKSHSFWQTPVLPAIFTIHYLGKRSPADFVTAQELHASTSQLLREGISTDV